ncbi:hypothetical protein FIBSPDRAFT_23492 [Athelia psychrophila]|uniref:Uncharacterized protein n=1 Tax=Athelia psychrophila TaxID=1759441 RepID=A0A166GCE5_9AGAM|nr:hypothetical protein FIBSPDRAFT_23492 [Fibularhizoctonia sp. CBS 109695]
MASAHARRRSQATFMLLFSLLMTTFLLCSYGYSSTVRRHVASSRILQLVARSQPAHAARTVLAKSRKDTLPLPRGQLPVVYRSILQKLALLETEPEPGHEVHYEEDDPAHSKNKNRATWPPLVTHIPEPNPSLHSSASTAAQQLQFPFQHTPPSTLPLPLFSHSVCGRPSCRFILPLRVPEQESKARLHFAQIMELGRRLQRIVVLPGVGRSRMGACARWDFGRYYDTGNLSLIGGTGARLETDEEGADTARVVDAETFRLWTATRPGPPRAQFVSLELAPFSGSRSFENSSVTLFGEQGLTAEVLNPASLANISSELELASTSLFPDARCLPMKYPRLELRRFAPITIRPPSRGKERKGGFGAKLVRLLGREDVKAASHVHQDDEDIAAGVPEPDVLVLSYDLRHPLFAPSPPPPPPPVELEYAPALKILAKKLDPSSGPLPLGGRDDADDYLVIHWRMETVPPDDLPLCAEKLVDTLVGLLHPHGQGQPRARSHDGGGLDMDTGVSWEDKDHEQEQEQEREQERDPRETETGSSSIRSSRTVWFASDYPYPITSSSSGSMLEDLPSPKSGTFKNLAPAHAAAISILRAAFLADGPLRGTKLTGLAEELRRVRDRALAENANKGIGIDGEMADDMGVLGILDKLVAIRAGLFISGGKGCGRVSSFTKQIVDARKAAIAEGGEAGLRMRNVVEYFG